MPTEHIPPAPGHTFEPSVVAATQIKVCSVCHGPLDTAELVFTLARMGPDDVCPSPAPAPGVVCSPCADRARVQAIDRAMAEPLRIRRQSTLEPMVEEPSAESDGDSPSGGPQTPPPDVRPGRGLTPLTIPSRSPVRSPTTAFAHSSSRVAHSMAAHSAAQHPPSPPRSPPARLDPAAFGRELDPYADVTRLRLKHTRQDCLYPGASFVGIQKSGRNSYNVSVTIVNVDFPGSTLCGYLTIENLTDDHPQLTTYFDAEIIGPKYGFLTQSYGASESDDMTHWGRFDSFRSIKSEMRRPGLTIRQKSLSERGFIFMRWKERFLVPEHQVRGIRGASYDGFYYVCVQLNSQAESPLHTHSPIRETTSPIQTYHPLPVQQTTPTPTHVPAPPSPTRTRSMSSASARTIGPISPEVLQSTDEFPPLSPTQRQHQAPVSPPSPRITRSHSHSFRSNSQDTWGGGGRGASSRMPTVSATMTGFYFHQNSEPYQQLTLHYQPERNTSVFEFR